MGFIFFSDRKFQGAHLLQTILAFALSPLALIRMTHLQIPSNQIPLAALLWSLLLSLGWLLPNHYAPWASFHSDAWIAILFLVAVLVLLKQVPDRVSLEGIDFVVAGAALIPVFHYFLGMIGFSSQVWISTLYILALLLALLLGRRWGNSNKNQAVDSLFLAIFVACMVSMFLALNQWFTLFHPNLEFWTTGTPTERVFANFNQPNVFASFLIWGIIGVFWWVQRGYLRIRFAILLGIFFLVGVSLTQSRTATVALIGLFFASMWTRNLWSTKLLLTFVSLLGFYLAMVSLVPWFSTMLLLGGEEGMLQRDSYRLPAYRLFFDALLDKPWSGYGWSQTVLAHLAVAERHPPMVGIFAHAHNLFLDLLIWNGIPLGLFFCVALTWWFIARARQIRTAEDALLFGFVGTIAWHSMVEFPLYYAYLLIPTGFVMGILHARLGIIPLATVSRIPVLAFCIVLVGVLGLLFKDYLLIENNFRIVRLERAGLVERSVLGPTRSLLLNQMDEVVEAGRNSPYKGMTTAQIDLLEKTTMSYPGPANLFALVLSKAWNGQTESARLLIPKIVKLCSKGDQRQMRRIWSQLSQTNPEIALIKWPD